MTQRRGGLPLATEAFERLRVVAEETDLEGDVVIQACIAREVDGSHASLAERPEDAVWPERVR